MYFETDRYRLSDITSCIHDYVMLIIKVHVSIIIVLFESSYYYIYFYFQYVIIFDYNLLNVCSIILELNMK